eukprot:10115242-Prorocentrum_lima.AAC.1
MTRSQAAKAGGSCGPHIKDAFGHLAQVDQPTPPPIDLEWRRQVLGAQYQEYERQFQDLPPLQGGLGPAIVFADQSKAFER